MRADRLRELLADGEIWRMKELADAGVSPATVRRAVLDGFVTQISRGTYRLAAAAQTERADLAGALARVPRGIACLQSAAAVHGLLAVDPEQVWIAIPNRLKTPKIYDLPARFVRWVDDRAFEVGIVRQTICGIEVKLTSPARTVVDTLRMASTVGDEIGHNALVAYFKRGGTYSEVAEISVSLGVEKRLSTGLRIAKAIADSR